MRRLLLAMASLAVMAGLVGCGGESARDVAQQYINDMKAGQFKDAAMLCDYTERARAENSDWDTFGESQRKLILDKQVPEWATAKAETLKLWATHFTVGIKIVECNETGDSAQATLEGGRVSAINLVKVGGHWLVKDME